MKGRRRRSLNASKEIRSEVQGGFVFTRTRIDGFLGLFREKKWEVKEENNLLTSVEIWKDREEMF